MNILLMISTLAHGGAEHQVVRLANTFVSMGHNVTVCSLVDYAPLEDQLDATIKYVGLGVVRGKNFSSAIGLLKAVGRLHKIIRQNKIDVVHTHTFPANIFSRLFKMVTLSKFLLINTSHTTRETSDLGYVLYKMLLRYSDFCTHISPLSLREYQERKIFGKNSRYIPNGLNLVYFDFNPEARLKIRESMHLKSEFVWICVGRFEEPKDHCNLIQAWESYQKSSAGDDKLLLVGDGPLMETVKAQVKASKLEKSVIFYGISKQIPDLLSASDALVLGSNREGLPLVLQEGAAIGLPIVCTNVGAVSEIVDDLKTGLIVDIKSPDKLAQAMIEVKNNPNYFTKDFKVMTREIIEKKFSITEIALVWIDLYEGLMSKRPSSGH